MCGVEAVCKAMIVVCVLLLGLSNRELWSSCDNYFPIPLSLSFVPNKVTGSCEPSTQLDVATIYNLTWQVKGITQRADGQRGWTFTIKDTKTGQEAKEVRPPPDPNLPIELSFTHMP